ncbi:MAG: twin-arginine translocation signal domain-containing protein, partial [Phycisphaerales bacterium]|nr:twin-arginine translocation signal domain-containing protein [Phycisphaerales bacterium]
MRPHDRRTFLTTTAGGMAALALGPMVEPLLASPLRAPRSIGVIGMGRQGRAIVAELQKIGNVTIAAVCDTEEGRLST